MGAEANLRGSAGGIAALPLISPTEVAQHSSKTDCWISVHGKVLDITSRIPKHPGGDVFTCGRDMTTAFEGQHGDVNVLNGFIARFPEDIKYIGEFADWTAPGNMSATCPSECQAPQCRNGFAPFEGWQKLQGSRCYHRCSAPNVNGKRFCGTGEPFQTEGSVDCSVCMPSSKSADFGIQTADGAISGAFTISKMKEAVEWETGALSIDNAVVDKFCGKLMSGTPTFKYHLHTDWNFPADKLSSVGDCSLENVGNHWDPTAACGKASGNPVCDEDYCGTRGNDYTCNANKFDPTDEFQYRMFYPSPLFQDNVVCEFGDLSGMAGPIEGREDIEAKKVITEVHRGNAAMTTAFGEITPDTVERPCQVSAKAAPERNVYRLASKKYPLDQLPVDASVLVHCGANYENANARFFCAKLQ